MPKLLSPNPLLEIIIGEEPTTNVRVKLDWRAYYREFSATHGDHPLLIGGRLVFEDGWSYSSSDYAGPEWAPPERLLVRYKLLKSYWEKRLKIATIEQKRLNVSVNALRMLQEGKSLPIKQLVKTFDDDANRTAFQSIDLDFVELKGRLAWLEDDIQQCQQELDLIKEYTDDDVNRTDA